MDSPRQQGMVGSRSMLLPRAFYFFYFAAAACLIPFIPLYYEQIGLSGTQIGLLVGIPPLVTIFSSPIWGALADVTRQHKRLLMMAIVGSMAFIFSFTTTSSFVVLIPLVFGYAFFVAPLIPMIDHTTLTLLGERKDQYGKQRLWGAIGWGAAGPLIGILAQRYGLTINFYLFLAMFAATLVVSARLAVSPVHVELQYWTGLRRLLANRRLAVFLLVVLVGGASFSMFASFLFLHLQGIGGTKTLMGFALAFATMSEIPVFLYSDRLLARLGARNLLLVSLSSFVVRILLVSLLRVPWMILPLQWMHGLTFSTMLIAGVSYMAEIAPEGMGATAQSLFNSMLMGVGGMFGGLIGGSLYDTIGTAAMFRSLAVGLVIFLLVFRFLSGNRRSAR